MLLSSEELCDFGIASLKQYNVEYYSGVGFHIIYGRGDRKNKNSCLTFTRSTRNDDTKENVVLFSLSLSLSTGRPICTIKKKGKKYINETKEAKVHRGFISK